MAKIIFRNAANGTVNDSANVDANNTGTGSGNEPANRSVNEGSREPVRNDSEPASDNRTVSVREHGNNASTNRDFNPDNYEYVNPISATNNDVNGTSRRRRRSDAGTRRGTRKRNDTETTQDLKSLLLTIHFWLAVMFKTEYLKFTESEAETLGAAIKRVTDLYDVRILPEKQMAWINLTIVAGAVYLPRFKTMKDETKQRDKSQSPQSLRVMPMTGTQGVSGDANKVM